MKITINKPCHEDWDKMSPNDKGAFCAVCTKDVIDFSKKSLEEIKNFFAKPIQGKICGRFKEQQLEELSFESFFERFTSFKLTKKVLVIVALAFANWFILAGQLTAQTNYKTGKIAIVKTNTVTPTSNQGQDENVKGQVKVNPKDTAKCATPRIEQIKMGEVAAPPKKKKTSNKKKSVKANKNIPKKEVKEEYILKGDVSIEDSNTK